MSKDTALPMNGRQTRDRGSERGGGAALLQELRQRLAGWRPQFIGTLMFIRDRRRVLLIRKKRGLGAGRINAPGGKIEAGESPLACAMRETREEIGVTVRQATLMAELRFVERVDQQWYGYAFVASDFAGTPTETVEATPHWFADADIPYGEMWEDDRLWLPHLLAGRFVKADFLFESSAALAHQLQWTAMRHGGIKLSSPGTPSGTMGVSR
ncbi:MAG: 8-oxo-dGTP diphosphatase [Gammaproteobacteria bacterium]|nr:8-oxo-dGTP diphosphatase [Gammaproteobacteria bacterium]